MSFPRFETTELNDPVSRKNWEKLRDYLREDNALQGFRHFELEFSKNESGLLVPHGLGYLPKDIIQTSIKGTGTLTFNYDAFTSTYLNFTVSGTSASDPLIVRFLAGTYNKGAL